MVKRLGSLVAMVLIAIFALAACGTPSDSVEPTVTRIPDPLNAPVIQPTGASGSESPVATVPSAGPPVTLDLELRDISFDKDTLEVPANTQVTINLKNTGAAVHNFNIDDLNVHSGDIEGGGTGSVTFNSGPAGTHDYHCNIPGHKEAGMDGTLTVTGGAESAAPTEAAAAPTAPAGNAAPAAQTTIEIDLEDIAFNIKEFTVPENTDITINVKNVGAAVHNFNIDALDVHSGDLAGGESKTLTFNSGKAGDLEYYCNIPGHKEAGMDGTMHVVAAGGGEAAPPATAAASPTAPAASTPGAAESEASPAAAAQTTYDLELEDIFFSLKTMEVPANSDITINITNKGSAVHNFNIDELNVHSGDVAAGESKTVTFNSGAAGTYTYYCNIPGHKEAGMIGQLTVVSGSGDAAPAAAASAAAASPVATEAAAAVASPATTPAASSTTSPAAASPVASPVASQASTPAASPAASPVASPAASPAAAAQTTFEIDLKDISFSVRSITVPANTEITINLKNVGAATHNFSIDALKVNSGEVASGATKTITFNSGAAGKYTYYCDIPGHKDAGMVGQLVVQ